MTLDELFQLATSQLSRANADQRHAFKNAVLSTYDSEHAAVRWVVNRGWSEDHVFTIYTDYRSPKVEALSRFPYVEISFYDRKRRLQIRALCTCSIVTLGPEYERHLEKAKNRRKDYSTASPPGTETTGPIEYGADMHFSLIVATVLSYDILLLGDPHQRASYSRTDAWSGTYFVP